MAGNHNATAINVKAFLEKEGDVKGEIRRFQVPAGSRDLYGVLVEKVSEIFSLPQSGFRLYWQDTDGDFVTFSSTMELMEAVRFSPESVLRLFVRPITMAQDGPRPSSSQGMQSGKMEDEKVLHPGVVCDGCNQPLYGPRYKCVICPDYDLCSACEQKGIHPEHDKFKITHPKTAGGPGGLMPPHFRRWMHRFMRRCHGAQSPAGGATGQAAGQGGNGASQSQDGASNEQDEYLKDVGENIRAFLDPFGIEVSYEVRHDDTTPHPDCPRWTWGMFGQGGCVPPQCPRQSEKPAEKAEEKPTEDAASEGHEVPIVLEDSPLEPATPSDASKRDTSPARSGDEDWMMVHEMSTDGHEVPASASAPSEGLYPNLKVAQSVEMMKAMGFTDEGGCLTRLLAGTDGDIAKALDTLKLGVEQASRLA